MLSLESGHEWSECVAGFVNGMADIPEPATVVVDGALADCRSEELQFRNDALGLARKQDPSFTVDDIEAVMDRERRDASRDQLSKVLLHRYRDQYTQAKRQTRPEE